MPEYYDVLCITRSAQREAISKAYRMSSLKYHPDNNSSITDDASRRELEQKFRLVAEAYEVLSDPKYRAIYDCYGEDGLIQQGYKFSGNAIKVFECFFGVDSPFQLLGGHSYFTQEPNRDRSRDSVPPCIVVTLPLTIEEVYTGCRKIISYQTQHYNNVDVLVRNVPSQDRTLEVHIPRGVQHETEFYFPSCGNTKDESREPGTVRVKIEILPHERFSISKGTSNLTTVRTISLSEALCGFPMSIRTPDQRQLDIFIDEVVHPSYRRILPGEGMPVYDSTDEHTASAPKTTVFGDLVIEFRTEFPRYLSVSQKGEIARILDLKS